MDAFINIEESSSFQTKIVRHSLDKTKKTMWDFDYGKLTDTKFFFRFSSLIPIGDEKAVRLMHSYEFVTQDSSLVNPDSDELASLFASLNIRTIDLANAKSEEFSLSHLGLDNLKDTWKIMLKQHEASPPKEHWLVKSGKVERRVITMCLNMFSTMIGVAFSTYLFIIVFLQLLDFKNDKIGILNYGFAIMIGFSAVCFSWARNIASENKKRADRITDNASEALFGSIAFLMGMAFQHTAITKDVPYITFMLSYSWVIFIFKILAAICFLVASYITTRVMKELLLITMLTRMESYERRKDWRQHE